MAGHEESGGMHHDTGQTPLTLALSFVAGGGLILIMLGLMVGVVDPSQEGLVWMSFVAGILLFIAGGVAWFGVVRPHEHFDDINVPLYHGHTDHHADDHAIVVADDHTPADTAH